LRDDNARVGRLVWFVTALPRACLERFATLPSVASSSFLPSRCALFSAMLARRCAPGHAPGYYAGPADWRLWLPFRWRRLRLRYSFSSRLRLSARLGLLGVLLACCEPWVRVGGRLWVAARGCQVRANAALTSFGTITDVILRILVPGRTSRTLTTPHYLVLFLCLVFVVLSRGVMLVAAACLRLFLRLPACGVLDLPG